ncbi:interferon-induced very large GTPase 1-like [Aquarana catesbeiana]|uniref:interferon-induced very large GTPase 1-like n=1 Tax=Aquarana catesbeiana TaxID=8400 RepID=UPI003CC999DA
MASGTDSAETMKRLRWKLLEAFEKDAEGLCDELGSQGLITPDEMIQLQRDKDPRGRVEKMMNIILQKEEDCQTFLCHLEKMIPRFPALRDLSQHFPENKLKIFHELFVSLHMEHLIDSKLTLSQILGIGAETLSDVHPQTIQDVPWNFLRKLMALNRTALNTQYGKSEEIIKSNENNTLFTLSMTEEESSSESIHPLDMLCVLLHCSDSFLQQEIVSKLSMCQFGIPLLLPAGDGSHCTLMLWAMRDIVKKWRPQSLAKSKGFSEENVVNVSMPIFSFIRLGDSKLSKSKILNKVLNSAQEEQNIFIHDDMEGGNIERKISNGLVEMSWYFPCGNSDVFPEPITVTNLRGDLESNWDQFMFLTRVSSAVFIFTESISEKQFKLLSSFSNADTQFYLILTPEKGKKMNKETIKYINNLMPILKMSATNIITKISKENDAALAKKVRNAIENVLKNCQKEKRNLCSTKNKIEGLHIFVDENSVECQKAREKANQIISVIKDVEGYKKETLKLQGDLWKELSKIEKELCRMEKQGEKDVQEYQSELKQKRNSLHEKQYQHDVPVGISDFTEAITDLSKVEKHYFLRWMKFELDLIARDNISLLQSEYKKECNYKSDISKLKQLDQKISDSSLGIEHFLRELGQFYEAEYSMVANKQNKKITRQFTKLPGIAAGLLLDGFPLELIDGDASNIPLQWITDVLTELDNKTGGQCKMRTITVLGVQSTGKSTLLNTMFGLQFPVASGRCTRGAFMTLLNVKENFQEELGCHFILVIDTEGLKAPELASLEDSYKHDNELATLVVGLSDITIINMATENTSEMKDILQIVVHAFLRMKEIGKKANCQFVHQNVSDVSAHDNNTRERKKFLEQLNEMTRVAANMEKKCGITCFSDVINYDPEKHTWYIPGLWLGVPPMAPVNIGYSENVYELKKYLLGFLKSQNSNNTQCKILDFITWIKSLWSAVKHEKFIFNFRNSLVAEAYTKLSMQYSQWEWEFSKKIHSWMITKETYIRNQSAASLNDKMDKQFKTDLQSLLSEEENKTQKLLDKYFDSKCENVHLIERYKEDFSISVRFLKQKLERNTINKLAEAVSIQKCKHKILDIQKTSLERIEKEITILLNSCRERNCKPSDINVKREFEEMWKKTLSDLQMEELKKRNIGQTIFQQLKNEMDVKGSDINENLTNVMSLDDYGKNLFVPDKSYMSRNPVCLLQLDKIEDLSTALIDMCDTYIKEKVANKGDYSDTYFQELLCMINNTLNDNTSTKLNLSPKFELDIKLFIFGKASRAFQDLHDRFIQENDPKTCLEKFKPKYLATFESIFHEKDECQIRAKKFCDHCLKPALNNYILEHLGKEIINEILQNSDGHIFKSRSAFQFAVLKDLLKKKEVEQYFLYINKYRVFLKEWIFQYITEKYKGLSTLNILAEKLLTPIIEKIEEVLKSEKCVKKESIATFLESFCELLDKELVISQNEMAVITFHNKASVIQFSKEIYLFLLNMKQELLSNEELKDTELILSKVKLNPQEELLKKVIGCGKQCPFCNVPCENPCGDHKEHSASLHRPQGLGGCKSYKWHTWYKWNKKRTLITDICSTVVVSKTKFRNSDTEGEYHSYKNYRKYYPDWVIQPDANLKSSDYWKYVFVLFNNEFADEYSAKPAKLPKEWMKITEDQALASLQESFNFK